MKLSHLGLRAFLHAAQSSSVTAAAKTLGLTQSALSQRISQLEGELEATLFIREKRGLKLTPAGEKLLRYAQNNQRLEEEILNDLTGTHEEPAGMLRVAAFSSVLRSVIIPALAPFLRAHPRIHIDFRSYEVVELPGVLQSGQADLVIMDYQLTRKGVQELLLGFEEYVVIESLKHRGHTDVFLDNGPHDHATEEFFAGQSIPYSRRSFMGDTYGIIDGVEQGLGKAVMSRHLVRGNKKIRITRTGKKHRRPVTLHFHEQSFYPRLQQLITRELEARCAEFLS